MSFHTQSKQHNNFGRSFLSKKERQYKGLPYYACNAWLKMKEGIQARVARRVHRATTRRIEREEAKRLGVPVNYSIK